VFPVRRAVHRSRPNRTDIRVPHQSMRVYLPAPHRPAPPVVDPTDSRGGDGLTDKEQFVYRISEHFRLLTVSLLALTGLFTLVVQFFLCSYATFACDLYRSSWDNSWPGVLLYQVQVIPSFHLPLEHFWSIVDSLTLSPHDITMSMLLCTLSLFLAYNV
jgi:hypothetical protein